jgi:hypothetical protein
MESLESRIERLERSYHRAITAAILLAALLAVTVLSGQAKPPPTVIGNPNGSHLTRTPTGITVYDKSGKSRVSHA